MTAPRGRRPRRREDDFVEEKGELGGAERVRR